MRSICPSGLSGAASVSCRQSEGERDESLERYGVFIVDLTSRAPFLDPVRGLVLLPAALPSRLR